MGAILFRENFKGCFECCQSCDNVDVAEWVICVEGERQFRSTSSGQKGGRRRRSGTGDKFPEVGQQRIEDLVKELFTVHDLNGNGMLEESELVTLNEKIAVLHHGQDLDTTEVRDKYKALFRSKLDPDGKPVPFSTFKVYAHEVLDGMDTDPEAQELILEQFIEEARSAAQVLRPVNPADLSDLIEFRTPARETDLIDMAAPVQPVVITSGMPNAAGVRGVGVPGMTVPGVAMPGVGMVPTVHHVPHMAAAGIPYTTAPAAMPYTTGRGPPGMPMVVPIAGGVPRTAMHGSDGI